MNERAGKLQLSTSQVIESFYPLRESYEKLVSASNAVKAAEHVSRNDIAHDGLFLLLYNTLSLICYGDNDPKDIELFFFAKLLRMQGLAPALTHCVKCGRDLRAQKEIRFSAPLGGAVCENCGGSFKKVSALSLEAFRRMMLLDNSEARKVVLPETVRDELSALIYNYAECVLDFTVMK